VNQVFFDQVRVPKANRIGAENQGWTVAKYLLEFERGGGSAPGLRVGLERVARIAEAAHDDDPHHRRRLAETEIAVSAIDISERRVLSELASGRNPGPASSMLKINGTEAMQRIDELSIAALGDYAHVEQRKARAPGSNVAPIGPESGLTAMPRYLNNRAATIYGGSNEIQRDIIARLVLGL
jgi:acyl-CoA dehydrogenase